MANPSNMSEERGDNLKKNSHWLPLLFFFIFLAALLYCVWLIWQEYVQARAIQTENQTRLELLLNQKKELEDLLRLSPCEASEKARPLFPPAGTPGAAKSTPNKPSNVKEEKVSKTEEAEKKLSPDNAEAACVFLVSLQGANKLSTGSGFFIAPGYIVTNRHVVGANPGRILVTSKSLGHPVAGKVIAESSGKGEDFALVQVDLPAQAHILPLHLARDVKKTQKVGAWGFPNIIGKNDPAYAALLKGENIKAVPELSYSEGVVSAVLDRSPKVIVHTAPISPGNSGGPLLDEAGNVVGINTMITLDEDSYRQASLALSADALAEFLQNNGVSLP